MYIFYDLRYLKLISLSIKILFINTDSQKNNLKYKIRN